MSRARLHQLLIEQLVEGETAAAQLRLLHTLGPMHQLQRTPQLDEVVTGTKGGRMRISDEGKQQVEMLLHQRADLAVREAFGGGIDRKASRTARSARWCS